MEKRKKLNIDITPLRLAVVIVGLVLIGINEYFMLNIPFLNMLFPIVLVITIYLTQPKEK